MCFTGGASPTEGYFFLDSRVLLAEPSSDNLVHSLQLKLLTSITVAAKVYTTDIPPTV
jgi:hypothetical protein